MYTITFFQRRICLKLRRQALRTNQEVFGDQNFDLEDFDDIFKFSNFLDLNTSECHEAYIKIRVAKYYQSDPLNMTANLQANQLKTQKYIFEVHFSGDVIEIHALIVNTSASPTLTKHKL